MTLANKIAFFLICALVVFTTLVYGTVHQPIIAIFYFFAAVLLVLWAIDGFASSTLRYSPNLLQIPLYGAAVYGFVQVIPFGSIAETAGISGIPRTISSDPFATRVAALHFFALAVLFSTSLVIVDSAKRIRRLTAVITVFGFAYAFFAILQSVLSPDKIYGIYAALAPFGSFVNRHNFAAFMEMSVALPMGLLFTGAIKRDKRLLYITAIALMGAALLLSGSRGGLMAFLAEIILLVMMTTAETSGKRIVLKLALSAALLAAVIGGAIFVGGETSLTRFTDAAAAKDVSTGRWEIWGTTLKVIGANMPLGAGFGAFAAAYTVFDDNSGLERVEQSHNDYLQVAADGGIVGIALGLVFLYFLIRTARRAVNVSNVYRRGVAVGSAAGIFAILVHSLFDFVLHTTAISILFLMLLTLLVVTRNRYEDDLEDPEHDRVKHRRKASVSSISDSRRTLRT